MKPFQEFLISLAGLSAGEHRYEFVIGDAFFAHLSYAEIEKGDLKVDLLLDKRDNMIELNFLFEGTVEVMCDRCADNFNLALEGENSLYLKYGDHYLEESEDVIVLPADQHQFDISQLLYEYIVLLLPLRKVHPEDVDGNSLCNPEVIAKLNSMSVSESVDPRWEALRKLKNDE
ncbi:MAG: DUF177 domain-containing protein [Bacteroidetes bacterium]|nr:DUF177 domain-containing protein [Bacteroidota bacterium]